jgi:uroporphyrinogen-III synthase
MPIKPALSSQLESKTIALPESRQLDVLAELCERRQAIVLRIPLVSILDTPNQQAVIAWLEGFITSPPDLLILLTGEGLRRLTAAASRNNIEPQFTDALSRVCKICRGPKPGRALRELGLKVDITAPIPTTDGIIDSLKQLSLNAKRVAVQLYGEDPNIKLMDFLDSCPLHSCTIVAPYIYASDSDSEKVQELILNLQSGRVDLIAFTSMAQIKRLFAVAKDSSLQDELEIGLENTDIAAVGPIVRDCLLEHGCRVSVMPESAYFMKPLVRAIEDFYAEK